MKRLPAILIITALSPALHASGWQVVGPGNSTCADWVGANETKRAEILSWMSGFATSENLQRAWSGKPEYQMKLFTREYVYGQVNTTCLKPANATSTMLNILFTLLKDFPVESK